MNLELHSAQQVADLLKIEVDTLYRYARKGRIQGMKIGKAWRFSTADVQQFLEQQRYFVPANEVNGVLLPDVLRNMPAALDI
jgi:excisionase family DNA binding protein